MIKIALPLAVALIVFVMMLIFFLSWIGSKKSDQSLTGDTDSLNQCKFCGYLFFEYKKKELLICPRCKSYLSSSEEEQA